MFFFDFTVHKKLKNRLEFHHDPYLGYLTVSPANVGSGFHTENEVEFAILQTCPAVIQEICNGYALAVFSPDGGHHVAPPGQSFILRTTRCFTVDEHHSVLPVYEGVLELLVMELVMEQRLSKQLRERQLEQKSKANQPSKTSPPSVKAKAIPKTT
jgi:hypothetical protein